MQCIMHHASRMRWPFHWSTPSSVQALATPARSVDDQDTSKQPTPLKQSHTGVRYSRSETIRLSQTPQQITNQALLSLKLSATRQQTVTSLNVSHDMTWHPAGCLHNIPAAQRVQGLQASGPESLAPW
jgi:hypothetical protein